MSLRKWSDLLYLALLVALVVSGCARIGGYTVLNAEAPAVAHPDGLKVRINPTQVQGLSVRLDSVPRAQFVALTEGPLLPARQAIPEQLTPKSPYYIIQTRGKVTGPATLEVVIPNEAEPWEALALYTFDGTTWQWLPTLLDDVREVLIAQVATLPANVMVMQTAPVPLQLYAGATLKPADQPDLSAVDVCDAATLRLQSDGSLKTSAPLAACAEMPRTLVVRNWSALDETPDVQTVRRILDDSLSTAADRKTHLQRLVQLTQQGGYVGLVVDYRGLPEDMRQAYTAFIQDLASALHAQQLWLGVTLPAAVFDESGAAQYGGYDWQALGEVADQVRLAMPLLPPAYEPEGEAVQLLRLALTHVERYKLYPIFYTLSTDGSRLEVADNILRYQGRAKALQPLPERVPAGATLTFGLDKPLTSTVHLATGAIAMAAQGKVYWLGNAEWLCARLNMAGRYHLGGVVLADGLDEGHIPGLTEAISTCKRNATLSQSTDITWIITDPNGESREVHQPIDQPLLSWKVPEQTGQFRIGVKLAGVDRGSVPVHVIAPTPTSAPTPTPLATPTPRATPTPSITYEATFVADVTVPDYTRFDPGTPFKKVWRVMNIGNLPWPANTTLVFGYGEAMTDQLQVPVGSVGVGQTVDIAVDMRAPDTDGTYLGYWALMADGQAIYGGGLVVAIVVGPEPTPTETPTPAP